jgi:hypothetical protein
MGFRSWSPADLVRQLKTLGFSQYCREFQTNEICGLHLPLLTEDHLKEIGVISIGHRILLIRRFAEIIAGKVIPSRPAITEQSTKQAEAKKPTPSSRTAKPDSGTASKATPTEVHSKAPSRLGTANPAKKIENSTQNQDQKVACIHCGRKFSSDLAQRHMNVCARYRSKMLKK